MSSSSGSIPFRSQKRLTDSPCSKSKPENSNPHTPKRLTEKSSTRSRNKSAAFSVKEIRQAAGSRLRSEEDPVGIVSSTKKKLVSSYNESDSKRIRTTKNPDKEKLPEKFEILGNFFNALDSSILLSKSRGSKPTLRNLSKQIENLTERRFGYVHLGQLKHLLPEAIEVKKILVFDETTCCMRPDLHVTLNADAIEYGDEKSKSVSKRSALRKVFRARLADFVKSHPQGDEVPEESLPELYNGSKPNEDEIKSVGSPAKQTLSQINNAATPVKLVSTLGEVPSTPAKTGLTPVNVASTPPDTPAQLVSASFSKKRSSESAKPDDASVDAPAKLARRTPRSLNFDDEKPMSITDVEDIDEGPEEEDVSSDDEILSILPEKLRQSIKEQERKAIEEQNPAISQAKRRRKMIACLPKLFNVIHYLIQSIRRWVLTKEELVQKIIAGHSDITDRREVEEQLILMQELVPEWMSEKTQSSGELLVCINKLASPITIRKRLVEENKQASSAS